MATLKELFLLYLNGSELSQITFVLCEVCMCEGVNMWWVMRTGIFKPVVEVLNLAVLVVLPRRGVTLIAVCAGNSVGFELVQLLRNFHDDCACLQVGAGCLVFCTICMRIGFQIV